MYSMQEKNIQKTNYIGKKCHFLKTLEISTKLSSLKHGSKLTKISWIKGGGKWYRINCILWNSHLVTCKVKILDKKNQRKTIKFEINCWNTPHSKSMDFQNPSQKSTKDQGRSAPTRSRLCGFLILCSKDFTAQVQVVLQVHLLKLGQ